jgi:tRNA pseudouridine13 synthase
MQGKSLLNRNYYLNHSAIPFHFAQSPRDFVVDEIPLYAFSGEGEHLVLHVRKKNLSTWEMVDIICNTTGAKAKEIGTAGLKDKNALTSQYISVPARIEEALEKFDHPQIKILSKVRHNNKIRTGHLKGNRFFIRLKKVLPVAAQKLDQAVSLIAKDGMPNYFGYQRFGNDGDNYKLGQEIVEGKRREKNKKKSRLFISAYQSHLFNLWLSRRIEVSKLVSGLKADEAAEVLNFDVNLVKQMRKQSHPFKMLPGDLCMHYPYGAIFYADDLEAEAKLFSEKDRAPTGLLVGKKVKKSEDIAHTIEKEFDAKCNEDGTRRYAFVFPEDIETEYKQDKAWYELHFTLPKGSYATVLIEELAKREIREEKITSRKQID